jgi:acyl-CoA thioesterase
MMTDLIHPFDRATALDDAGHDTRRGHTSEEYWAFLGPFGGVSSAILLRSVLEHRARVGEPLALTVNFCAPLARGEYFVTTLPLRTNRSTQHWSIVLSQGDETVLTATAVTAERRESWSHQPVPAPHRPPPEDLELFQSPTVSTWPRQYEFRFAAGALRAFEGGEQNPADSKSALWMRDATPRPLDHLALASMADAFFGRVFHAIGRVVPFGTVSLTTYFLADAQEVARHGEDRVFAIADAKRFNRSYNDQTIELWGADGTLLVTGVQVAYFKA